MIVGYSPIQQALMGTGFGWFMTAAGALMVYPLEYLGTSPKLQKLFLDAALGASAGVMLAASYFSLLAPAIEEANKIWPGYDWVIASIGFLGGGVVMVLAEIYLPDNVVESMAPPAINRAKRKASPEPARTRGRSKSKTPKSSSKSSSKDSLSELQRQKKLKSWKRILLLVIAISLHNAPEGGAVGVAFGALEERDATASLAAADKCVQVGCNPPSDGISFDGAWSVAVGIGLQNFPEGLAVSLPLRREGCSLGMAFFWGQLSGMVEVFSGVLGAYLVQYARVALPMALSGAAGAMVYVVCSELIPEAHGSGNDRAVNLGVMVGFVIMMAMDVSLG